MRVRERRERDALAPAADPGADAAERDRAPDAQAAVPDPERGPGARPRRSRLVVGDHVVDPAADDPERDRPDGDVGDRARAPPRATQRLSPIQIGDEDPGEDAQGVGPDGIGPRFQTPCEGSGWRPAAGSPQEAGVEAMASAPVMFCRVAAGTSVPLR